MKESPANEQEIESRKPNEGAGATQKGLKEAIGYNKSKTHHDTAQRLRKEQINFNLYLHII